ncbi:unnamed protein product [Timema podura]|uniref:Large ribosomal subunit protein mL40 n=1 Tax=Timema podura TaxID=61482 RepID=A0ABN7NFB7_TIMPD|nr:unnamed protein product [Timema podura]
MTAALKYFQDMSNDKVTLIRTAVVWYSDITFERTLRTDLGERLIDPKLIPFKACGPVRTPPIKDYESPDGEYIDVSKKWSYMYFQWSESPIFNFGGAVVGKREPTAIVFTLTM